jgi:leucyl aminopeptidase
LKTVVVPEFDSKRKGDFLIVPYFEGGIQAFEGSSLPDVKNILKSQDFLGKGEEMTLLYPEKGGSSRILLLGLGAKEKVTAESLRKCFSQAIRMARGKKCKKVQLLYPYKVSLTEDELLSGVFDACFLTNYSFDELKKASLKENPTFFIEELIVFGLDSKAQEKIEKIKTISDAVCFARNLVNGNADDITPERLVQEALKLKKLSPHVEVEIFDRKRLEKEKMGLILAVGKGAQVDPFLIRATYLGNPKSKQHFVFVGKGVTYDTGGLCLKPADGMLTMKCDMGGAAAVLGALKGAASLKIPVNITILAPVVENAIGSRSFKTGDVYSSYSGKTVEIINTDAEGRLILADAISYAVRNLKPTSTIILATLTGGMIIALGDEMAGLFSNDDHLSKKLEQASAKTGEPIWRMPLYDYKEALHSEVADLANLGGREASSMKAALFLQEFTENTSWAHLDIAGPAYFSKPKHYNTSKATGFGVRLLLSFLMDQR